MWNKTRWLNTWSGTGECYMIIRKVVEWRSSNYSTEPIVCLIKQDVTHSWPCRRPWLAVCLLCYYSVATTLWCSRCDWQVMCARIPLSRLFPQCGWDSRLFFLCLAAYWDRKKKMRLILMDFKQSCNNPLWHWVNPQDLHHIPTEWGISCQTTINYNIRGLEQTLTQSRCIAFLQGLLGD